MNDAPLKPQGVDDPRAAPRAGRSGPYRIDEGRTTYCALDGRVPLLASFTVTKFSVAVCRETR